jgi:sialic acid synthase SpsE
VAAVHPFVDFHKLSSFEAMDRAMLDAHEDVGGRLIISTGMCDEADVAFLDGWRKRGRNVTRRVDLLHATSAYPAPLESLNLKALEQPWCDGLSDHSRDTRTGAWAAALGAKVIEVHLRLDDTDSANPDYAAALSPEEFKTYVDGARWPLTVRYQDEAVIGDGRKRLQESEAAMSAYRVRT